MVPLTARLARMHARGNPEVISVDEVELPDLGPTDVRIAVAAAGVTYPDLLLRVGTLPAPSLPHALGFEVAGTIEEVGSEVRDLVAGARVVAELPRGGGYATRVAVPARAVLPIERAIGFAEAVTLFITGRTALLVLREARLAAGETVLVPAALGGVGSIAVRLALSMGATVIAAVGSEAKRGRTLALGAAAAVSFAQPGWADEARAATGGRGVDVVLQTTGGEVGRESLRALAPRGRLVMFGADNIVRPEPLAAEQVRSLLAQGQSLAGFALMRIPADVRARAFAELVERVARRELTLDIMRYPFAEVRKAHTDLMARATVGKVVLEMSGG